MSNLKGKFENGLIFIFDGKISILQPEQMIDIPPEYEKIINENFWDLLMVNQGEP